jgi:hypothetical protein
MELLGTTFSFFNEKFLAIALLLFLIGPLIEVLVRTTLGFKRSRSLNITAAGISLGACAVMVLIIYRLSVDINLFPAQAHGSNQGADPLAAFSLVLGLVGAILTVLTGLSVAAAWRAVDESNRALVRIEDIIAESNKASLSIVRLAAYIEAVDRASAARVFPDKHQQALHRNEIAKAFGQNNPVDVLNYFEDLLSQRDLLEEIGVQGIHYLETIFTDQQLESRQRRTLHTLLANVTSTS